MNARSLSFGRVVRWWVALVLVAAYVAVPTGLAAQGSSADRDAVLKALQAQRDAKAYRVHMTQNNGTLQTVLEYVAPDRFHIVAGSGSETIIVGDKTYERPRGGKWMPFPVDIGGIIAQFRDLKYLDQLAQGLTDVQRVGTDTLDGTPMMVYALKTDQKLGDIEVISTDKLWIGISDGLPHRQEIQSNVGAIATNTVSMIVYDPSIKIDPPL
jgi:hypothetical protein